MALMKNRQYNNTGVGYWKVAGINISYTGNVAQIFVIGFSDIDTRQEGLENKIAFENFICKGEDFDRYFKIDLLSEYQDNPLICAYNYLKNEVEVFDSSLDI